VGDETRDGRGGGGGGGRRVFGGFDACFVGVCACLEGAVVAEGAFGAETSVGAGLSEEAAGGALDPNKELIREEKKEVEGGGAALLLTLDAEVDVVVGEDCVADCEGGGGGG
jgi:hypothetical protein